MLNLSGCGSDKDVAAAKQEKNPAQNKESEANASRVEVRFDEIAEEYEAEDGTLLLRVDRNQPAVKLADNQAAEDAINKALQEYGISKGEGDLMGGSAEEILQWAEEDYKFLGKENWHEYAKETKFSSLRTDDKVISFYISSYANLGGAHPNAAGAAINFDTQTGERLTLEAVVKNTEEAVSFIETYILEETKKEAEEGMFFEGYESSIGDLLNENTWYLGDDGFHVIGNEYIISPHAAGILDFVIPYSEAEFLKDEYRL